LTIEPPVHSALELDIMRGGFAVAMLFALDGMKLFLPKGDLSRPVGIARFVDLRFVLARRRVLDRLAYVAVALYVLDRLTPWALLYLTLLLVAEVTIRSSEGAINHGNHLMTVVAITQLAAVALWNAQSQWDWGMREYLAATQAETIVWWTVQAIIAMYFTSGLSKLLLTGGRWVQRSPGLLVAATSRLETGGAMLVGGSRKRLARTERMIGELLSRPQVARLLFAFGLLIELVTPLGLWGENALLAVGIGLMLLHRANASLLLLPFPINQVLVFTYLVNVPRFFA
jgi:hypothetical protein